MFPLKHSSDARPGLEHALARFIALALLFGGVSGFCCGTTRAAEEPPATGPQTETRFPPLKLPDGFKATLFACDPLIEYPSVIARGPRPGTVFVAFDYMTGLGTEIVRRDDVRLVEDTDGDGYADRASVYATGFNSIEGLEYRDGTVYVMHAPYLTALRDTQGQGTADERRDLLTGLGLPPEENPVRLHCANGVVAGDDGWLYLALGDHGCDVARPEGDRLKLVGGGILRCRPDGRDLHVFSNHLRNIYDVALDDELNVFVRDNENDGGTYKQRVCHSFFSADHGYPYWYEDHPDEAMPPLADVGLGSSAGGVCYLGQQFPEQYRHNLFFCEWGRGVVRYPLAPVGSTFAPVKQIDFAIGADNDPYPFKPTDVIVDHDGSLLVSDWADGQRPVRGRGRIYRIGYVGAKDGGRGDAEKRGREEVTLPLTVEQLFEVSRKAHDVATQARAVRRLADLVDPVLVQHRLDAGAGDPALAARIATLGDGADPRVQLEVVIALGRLRWADAPQWLEKHLEQPDAALAHAVMQTLRASSNWPEVLKLLDESDSQPLRDIAVRALAERYEPAVVDGLIGRLQNEPIYARGREYADLLARVYKKPGPAEYWGYRPPPRPANIVAWEKTEAIAQALDRVLADPESQVWLAVLQRMQREKIPIRTATLSKYLKETRDDINVAVVLEALREQSGEEVRALLEAIIRGRVKAAAATRQQAVTILAEKLDEKTAGQLLDLLKHLEDGPVRVEVIRATRKFLRLETAPFVFGDLRSRDPEARAASLERLAELKYPWARTELLRLLEDADLRVRRTAAVAAGKLQAREAIERLLNLTRDPDAELRRAVLDSLRLLKEPRVVALAVEALADRETMPTALTCLRDLGGAEQATTVTDLAKRSPTPDVLVPVVRMLDAWHARAGLSPATRAELARDVAEIQGSSGALLSWKVTRRIALDRAGSLVAQFSSPGQSPPDADPALWHVALLASPESRVKLESAEPPTAGEVWLAYTDLVVPQEAPVELVAASGGTLDVWLNGKSIYHREQAGAFRADSDRFSATLAQGANRLLVQVASAEGNAEFQLRFRRKSSKAEHEQLIQAVLNRTGNAERGRTLFFAAEKSLCIKCHRLGEQGERAGPELTGVGGRFARVYVAESILDPNRTVAPSFETTAIVTASGQTLSGIKVAETDALLTLVDSQGQKRDVAKADIEERRTLPVSTMPEGLEKRFTQEEFIDLIAFLMSQRAK